jgi:integrase/recombinase XerD
MELLPGSVPEELTESQVRVLRAEDRVFAAMVDGRRSNTDSPLALSTLRAYSSSIRMFCAYLSDGRYGWAALCERMFGDVPSQVVFEWNFPRHTTDDAVPPGRRAFTQIEMQTFFDAADDLVDREFAAGSKRWMSALRDSTAFKIAYAYGLRRRELAMLSSTDSGPNPHVPDYRSFGAVQVRWAKGTAGSGPLRRTVLTVPKFEWVVDLLEFWLSTDGRGRFPMSARSSDLWPSERSPRASLVRSSTRSAGSGVSPGCRRS